MQLHIKFINTAKKFPNKVAIYDQATGQEYTYEKLLLASLILAKRFSANNEKYVGLLLPTSFGCIASILGSLIAGKTPVMINYSTGAIENSIYAQDKCNFHQIITSKKLLTKLNLKPIEGMILIEEELPQITILDKITAFTKSKMPLPILKNIIHTGSIEDVCVILFTSGSEKEPKAVQLTHKNILSQLKDFNQILNISTDDIFMAVLPFFHVFGLTINMWYALTIGASIVTHPNPLEYKTISSLVKKYKATIMMGTPAFFYGYLKKSNPGDFSSLKIAIAGADKLTPHIYEGFLKKHGVKIYEGYGTTETSPVISTNIPKAHKYGSVGKPLPSIKVKIVDRETDKELPPNELGKIMVKGDLVMLGYLDDLEETSFRIHDGWYDTGDMGYLDEEGYLWHKGRLKRFVKIGGEMVSLVKVESVMEKYLPEDAACCVVEIPNPIKGADIVAAITTTDCDKKKLLKNMKKELPNICIPKEIHVLEDIPMMPSGKINFREVEKICKLLHHKK